MVRLVVGSFTLAIVMDIFGIESYNLGFEECIAHLGTMFQQPGD